MNLKYWTQEEVRILLDSVAPSSAYNRLPGRSLKAIQKKWYNWKSCQKTGWTYHRYIESHPVG